MFTKILIVAALATNVAFCYPTPEEGSVKHYNGYKVIRAIPETQAQFESLLELANRDKYDFWQDPRPGGFADVMVSPVDYAEVAEFLGKAGIQTSIMIEDLEPLLFEERQQMRMRPSQGGMDWENYHTWEEVNQWLSTLVAANNSLLTSEKYGTSFEGRDLFVYKLSTGGSGKPAFWIDATIHAREWITTGVITYVMNQLVNNATSYSDLLSNIDFYFAPYINPDGHVYTHQADRMWRRTRSTENSTSCRGVDANRNFGFQFGGAGSSGTPCSETYRGKVAYSEPETLSVKDWILAQTNVNWQAFITLHSYSQLWMTPYGYTERAPEDYADLKRVGDAAAVALKGHFNTDYTVGNAGAILYLSSGSSRDWAKGEGGFKWVYTIELRDTGRYGFLLPPDQILDTAIETWSGIQVVAKELIR
ncbi:Carboxypeptidase A2 [Orchesella cincta]|uniref:Zinc carboxypeptidase A 1 n=1 Tax=Orchesella cincta TaxID=48709 RepID=A0A1D2MSL1_ORCCI|nr:Carboxypeptidase A2 [Orchesella cincta]